MSSIALRWAVVPVRTVPSYSAVVRSVMPESRWVRPVPTGATGLVMPGNTWPPPSALTLGSTESRMPVTRTVSPGRTMSSRAERILGSRDAISTTSASSTSSAPPAYRSVPPNRRSSTGNSASSSGVACRPPLMTPRPA